MNNLYFGIMLAFALGGSFLIGKEQGKKEAVKAMSNILSKTTDKLNEYLKEASYGNKKEDDKEDKADPGKLN